MALSSGLPPPVHLGIGERPTGVPSNRRGGCALLHGNLVFLGELAALPPATGDSRTVSGKANGTRGEAYLRARSSWCAVITSIGLESARTWSGNSSPLIPGKRTSITRHSTSTRSGLTDTFPPTQRGHLKPCLSEKVVERRAHQWIIVDQAAPVAEA
jgi:hypothetical protein